MHNSVGDDDGCVGEDGCGELEGLDVVVLSEVKPSPSSSLSLDA